MIISPELVELLKRTPLVVSFEEFISFVENEFPDIGIVERVEPILEGYESANVILFASNGKFVIKIFEAGRNLQNIKDTVMVLEQLTSARIPTTKPVKGIHGFLAKFANQTDTYFCVTVFAEGDNFERIFPTQDDFSNIARYLATINTFNFQVFEAYDSWGNKNLLREYEKQKIKLNLEQLTLIDSTINKFATIDFSRLPKGFIHGDMQRKHVFKDTLGNYCILDFGCMSFDSRIVDLSTYLAWFCLLQDTWNERQIILESVLTAYQEVVQLTPYELEVLPILTESAYASYFQTTSVLITEGNTSDETRGWHDKAKEMLLKIRGWDWKY